MSNLVKRLYMTLPPTEEKRVIDSNGLFLRRLEQAAAMAAPDAEEEGGFVAGLGAEVVSVPEDEGSNVIRARDEAKEILEQAQADAESILTKAQADAERILEEAKAQAAEEKLRAAEQGEEQGYADGLVRAQARERALEQDYAKKAQELEASYERQTAELEPRLTDIISGIYEHIFHVELSSYREILVSLISDTLHKLEGSRSFIIHVSKEDYAYVNMQKKQMLAGAVSGNIGVDVVEDLTLEKNECMIETDGGIFDCGLGTQLSELRRRLKLLSWEA